MAYNGWHNYKTWVVGVDIMNDPALLSHLSQLGIGKDNHDFSKAIKEHYEENVPELPLPYNDLMNSALHEVSWLNIAETLKKNYKVDDDSNDDDGDGDDDSEE